jgi:hypothetical protein
MKRRKSDIIPNRLFQFLRFTNLIKLGSGSGTPNIWPIYQNEIINTGYKQGCCVCKVIKRKREAVAQSTKSLFLKRYTPPEGRDSGRVSYPTGM